MHHFVGADNSCISWGHAQHGELGYGPNGQKYGFSILTTTDTTIDNIKGEKKVNETRKEQEKTRR